MKITEISVSYEETCSLPGYNNVRPGVKLTALIDPENEPPDAMRSILMEKARNTVYEEVDFALMRAHKAPKHFQGQLYKLLHSHRRKVFLVIPQENDSYPDDFRAAFAADCDTENLLLAQAQEYGELIACKRGIGDIMITMSDCDYSTLPLIPAPSNGSQDEDETEFDEEADEDDPPF